MDLHKALYGRRSVRHHMDSPAPEQIIRELTDAAVQAPSAMDVQPWHFTVIRNITMLDRISLVAKMADLGVQATPVRALLISPDFHTLNPPYLRLGQILHDRFEKCATFFLS